jgi:hypothetical protein
MNRELNCVDCRNVFFGGIHSSFGNGLGVCNICQANRQANERFEKEMAQRRKYERLNEVDRGEPLLTSSPSQSTASFGDAVMSLVMTILAIALAILILVFLADSSKKEYSFYTPNNGSLKQSLKTGVVYHQHKCVKHAGLTDDPSSCVEIPKEDFERFCNEFDGINAVDNKEILGWKTGEITSLSREVDRRFDNPYCRIEFTMILDGKVKTGKANVITWTVNADGKLVPYSSYGSTRWE